MDGTILNKKYNLVGRIEALEEGGGGSSTEIAPEFSETSQYLEGDLVFHEGELFRFESNHEPGAWNESEVMGTNISENLVMLPGDGLHRTMHEFSVKLGDGLSFDSNRAIKASGELSVNQNAVWFDNDGRGVTSIPIATNDIISACASNSQAIIIPFWGNDGYYHLKALESADMSPIKNLNVTVRIFYRSKPSATSKKKK